jgi:hypothetical protein
MSVTAIIVSTVTGRAKCSVPPETHASRNDDAPMRRSKSADKFLEANVVLPLELVHPNRRIVSSPPRVAALGSKSIGGLNRFRRKHQHGLLQESRFNC